MAVHAAQNAVTEEKDRAERTAGPLANESRKAVQAALADLS